MEAREPLPLELELDSDREEEPAGGEERRGMVGRRGGELIWSDKLLRNQQLQPKGQSQQHTAVYAEKE